MMTNSENHLTYLVSDKTPHREAVMKVISAINENDEAEMRKIFAEEKMNASEIPDGFRKRILLKYGRYMSFGSFLDEYEQKLGIDRREYTKYELLKLSLILMEGRGTRVKQNFYLSIYYLARLFYEENRDTEIYVLNQPAPEEEKRGFEHYLRGDDMRKAKSDLQTLLDMGCSQAMKPLSDVLAALEENENAKYWGQLSKLYDPLSYGNALTTLAAAMQGRFTALEELSKLSDNPHKGSLFRNPMQIKSIIDTWMIRYYEQMAYDGYGTALLRLSGYYGDKENRSKEKEYLSLACDLGCGFAHKEMYFDIMLNLSSSMISNSTLSESELDQASYHYESAVAAGVVSLEKEKQTLKKFRKKYHQYSYDAAASSAKTASAMKQYRKKLDSREERNNFFLVGAPLTDETLGMLGLVTKNTDLMSYAAMGQMSRKRDESRHKEKLIREQLDDKRRKDRLSHPAENYSMEGIHDQSVSFDAGSSAQNAGLDVFGNEGYDISMLSSEEYAASLFCPCCGRRMTGTSNRLVCRCCHTFVNVPEENRELFIRLYNITHMYRQNGSFYEAMSYADLMAQHFTDLPDAYWARLLARCGVVFVEGAYLYHIKRYTPDALMYDEDFIKLMELTEGEEKAWYYEMEEDFSASLSDCLQMANRTKDKWYRQVMLCCAKDDIPAREYAERFKREADPSTQILDINDLNVDCDIDDEAIIYYGIKYCRALIVIASSYDYASSCSNIYMRFSAYSRVHFGRLLAPVAVGSEKGIFDGVFKNGARFTDMDKVKAVEMTILKELGESDDKNPYLIGNKDTPGSGFVRRLNQWRCSRGLEEKPDRSSGDKIKKIEIEVKEPDVFNSLQDRLVNYFCFNPRGQFVIRITFRTPFSNYTDAELNAYVYDQDDNLVYCNEGSIRFAPGDDLYMLTFNQADTDGTPFLREDSVYYVAFRYGDEWVYTGFYVASSQENRFLKDMANMLNVTLPEEAAKLSREEREKVWLSKTRELINRRIVVSKPGWKISECTEKVSKAFKGEQKVGHFAILSPDGHVRAFSNCKGRDQMIQTGFWQNITDVLCIKSGTIGLTKGRFLLYSGTDNRLRDIIRPLRDVAGAFEFTMDFSRDLRALVVAQPYRALMITPTQVTQINGDFSHGACVKKIKQNNYVSYNIVPQAPEFERKLYDEYGKLDGIDRTTGKLYAFGRHIADNVLQISECKHKQVWLDFFGGIHSDQEDYAGPIEAQLKKRRAKALFSYELTLYGVMPDNSVEVIYGRDELGILEYQNQ